MPPRRWCCLFRRTAGVRHSAPQPGRFGASHGFVNVCRRHRYGLPGRQRCLEMLRPYHLGRRLREKHTGNLTDGISCVSTIGGVKTVIPPKGSSGASADACEAIGSTKTLRNAPQWASGWALLPPMPNDVQPRLRPGNRRLRKCRLKCVPIMLLRSAGGFVVLGLLASIPSATTLAVIWWAIRWPADKLRSILEVMPMADVQSAATQAGGSHHW